MLVSKIIMMHGHKKCNYIRYLSTIVHDGLVDGREIENIYGKKKLFCKKFSPRMKVGNMLVLHGHLILIYIIFIKKYIYII